MATPSTNVVIIDQTHKIDPTSLQNAAVSLNAQVTQDLPKYWSGISANVSSAPSIIGGEFLAGVSGQVAATGRRRLPPRQAQPTLREGYRHTQ